MDRLNHSPALYLCICVIYEESYKDLFFIWTDRIIHLHCICVAWWIYGDLLVILGSPRVIYYTGYTFDFIVNISSMYHIKSSVKVI